MYSLVSMTWTSSSEIPKRALVLRFLWKAMNFALSGLICEALRKHLRPCEKPPPSIQSRLEVLVTKDYEALKKLLQTHLTICGMVNQALLETARRFVRLDLESTLSFRHICCTPQPHDWSPHNTAGGDNCICWGRVSNTLGLSTDLHPLSRVGG